jgi:hypothetical protein
MPWVSWGFPWVWAGRGAFPAQTLTAPTNGWREAGSARQHPIFRAREGGADQRRGF